VTEQRKPEDSPKDLAEVRALLTAQSDVLAAYVFGSTASGGARETSDLDAAVLLGADRSPGALTERRLELGRLLDARTDRSVDLVILNGASSVLQVEVLRGGSLIYERDRSARVEFEVEAGRTYADLRPMRAFFRQALVREIEEGYLGGRRWRDPGPSLDAAE
jgi:predicted nucleotidyltransferase